MTTRQPISQTYRYMITIAYLVIFMAIVFMTVDYSGLKGGDAYAADTWDEDVTTWPLTGSTVTIETRYYMYVPKPDITAWEIALILPVFSVSNASEYIDELPPEAKRHFSLHE